MTRQAPYHGGNLDAAARHFGVAKEDWLDLSTGINPLPFPLPDIPAARWARLPDPGDMERLLSVARAYYGFPDSAGLVASSGTQALLQVLPQVVGRGPVAIVSPTYAEHAYSWRTAGREVLEVPSLAEGVEVADIVVTVEPNNPDGRVYGKSTLIAAAQTLAAKNGLLIVDGAFADVAPDADVSQEAGRAGLLVLRSFGKFFGLAGVRLSFAAGEPRFVEMLKTRLGPWAVSGPAIEVGRKALLSDAWVAETRESLSNAAKRLSGLLEKHALTVVGRTDLFVLADVENANALYEHLGRQGILVRPFDYNNKWLRFGLPGAEADWQRLEDALGSANL